MIKDSEQEICLYADDVLCLITAPETSIPKLLSGLKEFPTYSGYKLNVQKTQILSYNYAPQKDILNRINSGWDSKEIKYLGIQIPKDLSKLNKCNFGPINKSIKSDIDRWSQLPFAMHNRIEIIKMNLLPRLLNLFQCLPVMITQMQFNEWDKRISRFIWPGKRPRIQFKTLQLSKEKGGRSLPCLFDYFKAAQLRPLVCCCNPNYTAKWKDFEISQLNIPLQSLLGSKPLYEQHLTKLNQWSKTCFYIWFKECKSSPPLERQSRLLRWVAFDPEFIPARIDGRFKYWVGTGITAYCSITSLGELDSFQKLSDKFGLEKNDFFRYLQIRSFFLDHIKPLKGQ